MNTVFLRAILLGTLAAGCFSLPVITSSDFSSPAFAQELNLKERRAIKAYEEKILPEHLKNIEAAAGFAVPVEIKWESLALKDQDENYSAEWYLTKVFFVPLSKALSAVTADSMGKTALKSALKKIVIHYDKETAPATAYEKGVSFSDGVLTLNFTPGTNADDVDSRAQAIEKVLSAGL